MYVIAQGRVEDHQTIDEYVSTAIPTIAAHGGRIVAFDETPEVVEGSNEYPRTVVLEFAEQTTFRARYDSPEYQAILPLRLASTPGRLIVANGFTPPQASWPRTG